VAEDDRAPSERRRGTPVHVQLTTGDIDAFRVVAERIFGEAFADVASVEVGRSACADVTGEGAG